jgi:hypothetical protein
VDLHGFTIRLCPHCGPAAAELKLRFVSGDTHLATAHECDGCGFFLRERFLRRRAQRPRSRPQRCSKVAANYEPRPWSIAS